MMPNVSRGDRMGGLLRYLQGPGKANEHTNPHLVGGDDTLMSWFGREELSSGDAQAVARHLDAPFAEAQSRLGGQGAAQVQGGHVWHCSLSLPAREGQLSDDQWQAIASDFIIEMRWMVPAATQAPDASREAVLVGAGTVGGTQAGGADGTAAGLIGGSVANPDSRGVVVTETSLQLTAASSDAGPGSAAMRGGSVGRVPAVLRWAAVRHGLSKNGNDHVHLVVNLVAEGGGVANTYNDFLRAQKATRALERKHGLVQLASATQGLATRGWQPAEQQAAARRTAIAATEHARLSGTTTTGWSDLEAAARKAAIAGATKTAGGALGEALGMDQPRRVLEVSVRGASAASRTEGEFVRRLRDAGVLVRARFEKGSTTDGQGRVSGFSVALPPRYSASLGERPVWFGGGTLARDLTLPRLRSGWEQTEAAASAAAAEWNATNRARRTVAAPSTRRERKTFSSAQMAAHAQQVAAMSQRLAQVPAQNRPVWAKVAGHSAGTLSAWAISAARSGDAQSAALAPKLAAAAAVLSTSASTVAAPPPAETAGTIPLSGMAMLLASAARGGQGAVGQAVLLTQMVTLLEAVAQMAAVRRDLNTVQSLRSEVQGHLAEVRAALVTQGARLANASAMTASSSPSSTPSSTPSRTRVGSAYGIAAGAQREPGEQAEQKPAGGARAGSAAAARAATADPARSRQSRPVVSPGADRAGTEVESTVELTRRLVAGERARRLAAQARATAPQPTTQPTRQTPGQPTTQTPAAAAVASPTPDKPTTAATPTDRAAHSSVEQAAAARRAAEAKAAAEQAAHRRRRQAQAKSQDREGPVR